MSSIKDIGFYAQKIMQSARQIINCGLKPYNLISTEGNVLLHIFMTEEKEINQELLVEQLGIDKAAVSRTVNSLNEKGYLIREKRADDKRAYQLKLTEKALDTAPKIETIYNCVYNQAQLNIGEGEFEFLIGLLSRISQNFSYLSSSSYGKE